MYETTREAQPFLNRKTAKRRKRWMHFLDVLASLLLITPLVVAFWRGVWTLMDLKAGAVPAYPSLLIALAVLVGLHLLKEVFYDFYKRKRKYSENAWVGFKVGKRLNAHVFAVCCVAQWRGFWILLDGWLGVEVGADGRAIPGGADVFWVVSVLLGCICSLVLLKSVRNMLAVPFVVIVDHGDNLLFPTRFRLKVFYLCIFLFKNTPTASTPVEIEENVSESTKAVTNGTAEKLIGGPNLGVVLKQPPSPFINHIRGPSPASFIPLPTEKVSSAVLPQLQNYNRPPGFPRNIQDIINYIGLEKPAIPPPQRRPFVFPKHHDPFFPYKPKDPSDINLMATANLRFAPPSWKEIKTNLVPSQSVQKPEQPPLLQIPHKRPSRPLTLSLNIFPMANDAKHQNFYGFTSNANPRFVGNGRRKPRKMIIHLNVFGNHEIFEREDEEQDGTVLDQDYAALRDLASGENDEAKS